MRYKYTGLCQMHAKDRRAGEAPRQIRRTLSEVRQVNIEDLRVGDHVVSYRGGKIYKTGRPVTHVEKVEYAGDLVVVRTPSGAESRYVPQHQCIVRFSEELRESQVVYLMRRGDQFRIGMAGFSLKSQKEVSGLARRLHASGGEDVWLLSVHKTTQEAATEEALLQAKYGIPGTQFTTRGKNPVINLETFWSRLGSNRERGLQVLRDFGRLPEFPWHSNSGQKHNMNGRFVTAAANLVPGVTVAEYESVTIGRANKMPAITKERWVPIEVRREPYSGTIVSIGVAEHHTYFADGILTHNSWRGAVNMLNNFGGVIAPLQTSFRFGPAIGEYANGWLERLGSNLRINTLDKPSSVWKSDRLPEAVLCRTNAAAISEVVAAQKTGVPVGIAGERKTAELTELANAAKDLQQGRSPRHPELSAFNTWGDAVSYSESADGADLAPLVKLIDTYGADSILQAIRNCVPTEHARTVVSTAHVAKGLEWLHVRIAGDFHEPNKGKPMKAEEARLAYVAATRPTRHLDPSGLKWAEKFFARGGTVA